MDGDGSILFLKLFLISRFKKTSQKGIIIYYGTKTRKLKHVPKKKLQQII
jgi:hypothetical protein